MIGHIRNCVKPPDMSDIHENNDLRSWMDDNGLHMGCNSNLSYGLDVLKIFIYKVPDISKKTQ